MATARPSELPVIIVNTADSPRSRIGRGLESIGGMTAETLQRLSTAVGGVVKSPVVLMAKVGGLASPRAATLPSPPGSSLAERVYHLENQMKSLEEKFGPLTVVTELDLPSPSHKEKPRIAKSLLPEMETDRTLEQRVQMLEDRVNKRMDRFEKALSSIQSRLDNVEFGWRENVAGVERQESVSGEPQYYDAEQQSDNFEALEAAEQNSHGAHYIPGDAIAGYPTLEKLRVKESSPAAPTTAEHGEIDAGKNDDFLNPRVVSTPVYSKEAFFTQPSKSAAPSSEPAESVHRGDAGDLPASSDRQLASTLEELHGSFVRQSSAAAASAKFLEIARAVTAEKSTLAHAASGLQPASVIEEPREVFPEEPSVAVPVAKSEEHVQEDAADKSGATSAAAESPWPPTFEATQKDFSKEPLAAALNGKLAQELTTEGFVFIALPSSEPPEASQSVEEPSVAVPSANSEEPAREDTGDKSVTMTAAGESPKAVASQDPREDSVKESLAGAPGAEPANETSSRENSSTTSDMASKAVEEPSAAAPDDKFEEPAQEDAADESGTTIAAAEIPLATALGEPQENSVKEVTAAAPSAESAQVQATQEDIDVQVAAPETQRASKFVEEPPAAAPSADSEEPAQEDVADKSMAAPESSFPSSLEEPKEGFEKESSAAALSAEPAQERATHEDSSRALEAPETIAKSKFAEDPSAAAVASTGFEEPARDDANKGVTMTAAAESPLPTSHETSRQGREEDFESLAAAPSAGPIHEPSSQEDSSATSDKVLASSEPQVASKFVEEPSSDTPSANTEEPVQDDGAIKSDTVTADVNPPLASSIEGPQGGSEKESIVAAPSAKPAQVMATQEESDMASASSEPREASKFVEESWAAPPNAEPTHEISSQEDLDATRDAAFASSAPHLESKFVEKPSPATPSARSEEPAQDENAVKSDSVSAGADSPLASSFEEPQDDFEKEPLAATSSREPAQGLATDEDNRTAPTSSESEEPSAAVTSADFEEPKHEDAVDESVAVTAAGVSSSAPSVEGPEEAPEKESIAAAPSTEPARELASQEDSDMAPSEPQVTSKFTEETPAKDVPTAKFEEPAHEDTVDSSSSVTGASAKVLEPTEEEESGKSPIAFAPLEAPSASFLGIPKKPSETRVQPEESAQEKSGIVLPGAESTLTSPVEEGNHAAKETEYKSAEDFNVHHERVKSTEKEFPRSQSNLAHVGSDESLAAEDCDDRLESDQSGEEFFDAEHGSGSFEPWESDEPKPFEKFGVDSDEPGEAKGINAAAQKETLAPTPTLKPAREPEQGPRQETARDIAQEPEQTPVREFEQEPDEAPARVLEQGHETAKQAHAQEQEQKPAQEQEQHAHGQQPTLEREQRPAQEHGQLPAQEHEQEFGQQHGQAPGQEHEQEPALELGDKPEQQSESQPAQESEQDDLTENSAMALPPSEPQVASKSRESQELLAEEPVAAVPSTKFEESARANAADESGTRDLPLPSTAEEPQIDSVVSPEKSLSSASFHQSGNPELFENLEQKSADTPDANSTPQEAAPTAEIAQGHVAGKSDNVHTSLEPQLEESTEALAKEPVKAVPSSESSEPAQEGADGQSGVTPASSELQSAPTSEEPQEDVVKEPLADAESASKSVDLDEPSTVTKSAKLAPESVADKINAGIVEDSPLVPIAEEPQSGSPIEEAVPRTQSDLTHVKLNPEASEDATKLQSQGSFLAFGSTSVDSIEAQGKESLPSSKLLELFEEENNSGKRGPVPADTPMTSTAEEPQKPPPVAELETTLASAKSVPKGHGRWRGFARSSSEPQFAYKLEENRKALAKGSSVAAALPSASKPGEEHALEGDFDDTQCLPFRILGEGKPPRRESESKLVEDVKSPATKSETAPSPYVLEPKPSKIKVKKRKEKKEEKKEKKEEKKEERKPDAAAEEKERRLSLQTGGMERKSSLRAEEKGGKYSPRAEEKHKQPFRHLRDRLRHAFSVNKEP